MSLYCTETTVSVLSPCRGLTQTHMVSWKNELPINSQRLVERLCDCGALEVIIVKNNQTAYWIFDSIIN